MTDGRARGLLARRDPLLGQLLWELERCNDRCRPLSQTLATTWTRCPESVMMRGHTPLAVQRSLVCSKGVLRMSLVTSEFVLRARLALHAGFEDHGRIHLVSLGVFIIALLASVVAWRFHTPYWVEHFCFGVGFPFFVYAVLANRRVAVVLTVLWSLGNELWEDQLRRAAFSVDWPQLAADLVGVLVAGWLLSRIPLKATLPAATAGNPGAGEGRGMLTATWAGVVVAVAVCGVSLWSLKVAMQAGVDAREAIKVAKTQVDATYGSVSLQKEIELTSTIHSRALAIAETAISIGDSNDVKYDPTGTDRNYVPTNDAALQRQEAQEQIAWIEFSDAYRQFGAVTPELSGTVFNNLIAKASEAHRLLRLRAFYLSPYNAAQIASEGATMIRVSQAGHSLEDAAEAFKSCAHGVLSKSKPIESGDFKACPNKIQ